MGEELYSNFMHAITIIYTIVFKECRFCRLGFLWIVSYHPVLHMHCDSFKRFEFPGWQVICENCKNYIPPKICAV